jgi:hypothetical protein
MTASLQAIRNGGTLSPLVRSQPASSTRAGQPAGALDSHAALIAQA